MSATALARSETETGQSVADEMLVIWQHPASRALEPVALLSRGADGFRLRYLVRAEGVADFRPLLGFADLNRDYRSATLFSLFEGRTMSVRRPDYQQYVSMLGLDLDAGPWEQVARSEGHQATDSLQVFPMPRRGHDGEWSCRFLVHGIRHIAARNPEVESHLRRLQPGDHLRLRAEPDNPVSERAVLTCDHLDFPLGYVPHFLLDHLTVLQDHGPVTVVVETVNGPHTPGHLRLAALLSGTAPSQYVPFSSDGFGTRA